MALVSNTILFTVVVVIASILDFSTRVNCRVISPQPNTIKAQNGDIYDCVDFYKQPAFQHPLLKNHSFTPEMKPSFTPKTINGEGKTKNNTKDSFFRLKDGGCPFGTVPIRRVTKEQRGRATKWSSSELVNSSFTPNEFPNYPRVQWAGVQSKSAEPPRIYYGIGAQLGILNPHLDNGQYSAAQCMIKNGPDYIQFGWMVNRRMYHDTATRTFIRTEAGTTHCYYTDCPGFVIVRTDLPLDGVLSHHSSQEEIVSIEMKVYREQQSDNWWLKYNGEIIGFWPGQILSNLAKFGTYFECGGEVYSDSIDDNPIMGTGHTPMGSQYYDGFIEEFVTLDDKFEYVAAHNTELFSNGEKYGIISYGVLRGDTGITFLYGGPDDPSELFN